MPPHPGPLPRGERGKKRHEMPRLRIPTARALDPRLLMSRMTEGEKGGDARKGKAGTTRSFTSFRMTEGRRRE